MVRVSGSFNTNVQVGTRSHFQLEHVRDVRQLDVCIRAPSGDEVQASAAAKILKEIEQGGDTYRVEWTPTELGVYTISCSYGRASTVDVVGAGGEQTPSPAAVIGSPFQVRTYDPRRVRVYKLSDGCVGKLNLFYVDAGEAGEGSLEIGISSHGHFIANQVTPLGDSVFQVQFTPKHAGLHHATIAFNGEPVTGNPFAIHIADANNNNNNNKLAPHQSGSGNILPVNVPAVLPLLSGLMSVEVSKWRARVTSPTGETLPVRLVLEAEQSATLAVEFTPLSVGSHQIDVFSASTVDLPLAGSPFFANVYDPAQACEIVSLPRELVINVDNVIELNVSPSLAWCADLDVQCVAPSGARVPVSVDQQNQQTTRRIRVRPTETGSHTISIRLGAHLIGTPLTINGVHGSRVANMPVARGDGLHHAVEDRPACFVVDTQGAATKGSSLQVSIEGPNHYAKSHIERQPSVPGSFLVKYTPVECGLFNIYVKWNERDIVGSPFCATVVNPNKIKLLGQVFIFFTNFKKPQFWTILFSTQIIFNQWLGIFKF